MKPRSLSLEMFQYATASIALGMLIGLLPATAQAAGPPPSGTISCDVAATFRPPIAWGFEFRPFIDPDPRKMLIRARNSGSNCDDSNVVDGKGPIDGVAFKFSGRLRDGSCTTFTTTPNFEKGKVGLRWLGPNAHGNKRTVAVNNLKIASSSYDSGSHAVILTTEPIIKGAFVGKTVTLHLGLDAADAFENGCTVATPFAGVTFGQINPSTVVVQ